MSDWTFNGFGVLRAQLVVPLTGRWVADLEVDATEPITGRVTLTIGGVSWLGNVLRGGVEADTWSGRVVGGAGGLDRPVVARSWQGLQPARGLVTELLTEVGEVLSVSSSADVDANLPRWSRIDGPAHHALADLALAVGARWRMLPEGEVWIGVETWPELTLPEDAPAELLATDPRAGTSTLAFVGSYILPGQTFQGRRVGGVTYRLDDQRDRAVVWWAS